MEQRGRLSKAYRAARTSASIKVARTVNILTPLPLVGVSAFRDISGAIFAILRTADVADVSC